MAADSGDSAPLLVICGPTAAGKSALAMAVATTLGATIIAADSRQIYRGFDIGTAKPSRDDQARVPHAGLDLADPTERYSAYRWAAGAEQGMCASRTAGRVPLIVGGAGFYIRALVHPVTPHAPAGAVRHDARYLVVDPGPVLRERIAGRVAQMLAAGWLDEVRALMQTVPAHAPAWQASGYASMRDHVAGAVSLDAAIERTVIATRQYAKRQRTWFRHQLPADHVTRLDPDAADALERALEWARSGGWEGAGGSKTRPYVGRP